MCDKNIRKTGKWQNGFKAVQYCNVLSFLALVVLVSILANGCQKVINVNLNTVNPQLVVEGYVTNKQGIDTVKLSMTGSYFNQPVYPKVNGALVIITDNVGNTDTLPQVDSGTYANPNLLGVPGRTYTLKVISSGKEYDAISTMPQAVGIDSIYIYEYKTNGEYDSLYHVRCFFQDPPGVGHYYRLQLHVNSQIADSGGALSIYSDEFTPGQFENVRLSGNWILWNDTCKVDLMCIDKATYTYFSVVRTLVRSGNPVSTAVPQNPPTNITNGAAGYFSAQTLDYRTQVIN